MSRIIQTNKSGFTIVELLIVIVVIAILAAITVIAFNGIQNRAAATTLKSDLKGAATKLALSHVDSVSYPVGNTPPSDLVQSTDTTLQYISDGTTYCLTATSSRTDVPAFHVSNKNTSPTEGACAEHNTGGFEVVDLDCPANFIAVPGSTHYGTSDFCVMKYEARNVGGVATSQAAGAPWRSINQNNAKTAAMAACSGCKLISDPEWMTIAMNVISVPSNWSNGVVGSGYIYSGHNDAVPGDIIASGTDDSDGYFGTGNASGNQRRTLTLTTGETIWDLAGNLMEWTNGAIISGHPGRTGQTDYAWSNYTDPDFQWNSLPVTSRPTAPIYSSTQGVGAIQSKPGATGNRAFIRGGDWNDVANAGVIHMHLNYLPTTGATNIGFRASR